MEPKIKHLEKDVSQESKSFGEKLEEAGYIFVGDVWEELVKELQAKIGRMVRHGTKITLLIDSGGGIFQPTQSLIETIRLMGIEIDGIVIGRCYSMAIPLLLACKRRLAIPSARFFFHDTSVDSFKFKSGEPLEAILKRLRRFHGEVREQQMIYDQFCAERMGVSVARIRTLTLAGERDRAYLCAKEAMALGIVHEITKQKMIDAHSIVTGKKKR